MAFVAIGAITDNNHVIPYPAGAAGDFLLMYWEDDNGATAAVVGWQGTSAVMSNGHRIGYLWAAAPGAGSGTVTDTGLNTGGFCTAQIERHNNTDLSTPIAAGGVEVNSNIASSISPAMAGCTEVVAISYDSYQAGSQTPPSGWTRRQDTGIGENWYAVDRFLAAAGATGTTTFGAGTTGSTGMVHVALAPPGTPTAPGQVTGLTTVGKPGRADLSWSTPSSGNSAITDYLIERAPDVSGSPGTYTTVTHSAQTTTTYTDSGLTNGSIYWYRISAINAIGTGTASTAVSVAPIANAVVAATTFEVGTSMGSNNAIALPTGAASGDLIIVHANSDLNGAAGAITASAGYTAVTNGAQTQGTTVIGCNVFARVLDGSGSDALTVSGAAQDYVVNVIRITDHGVTQATINSTLFLTGTTGTTGNANPPIVNPATSNTWLWLAAMTLDLTTGNTITVAPSGYTMAENHVSASSTTSVAGAVAYKRSAAATSEDPGTFTNTSRAWIALSIAVPPAATGHVGGPVALAGQADGVATASATLSSSHVGAPVALAGQSDGTSTATGTLTSGPTVVQSVMTVPNTALAQTSTFTFPSPTVTGHAIVVFGMTTDTAFTAGQVTDNKGNTYQLGSFVYDPPTTICFGWWYCLNATGGAGHQVVLTAGAGKIGLGGVSEVAGLATTGTYDKHSESLQVAGTNPNAGSTGVLSQASEIVFAAVVNVTGATSASIAPQGGFTTAWDGQTANSGGQQLAWHGDYLVTSATTAVTPAWATSSSSWDAFTITFRGVGAHVGGPVALAGQADGVGGASGTLATPHVPGPVALAGQSDGVGTASGTLTSVGVLPHVTDDFNRADGALASPWTKPGASSVNMPQIVSGRVVAPAPAGTFYGGLYIAGTFGAYQSAQIDGARGADYSEINVLLRYLTTQNGYNFALVTSGNSFAGESVAGAACQIWRGTGGGGDTDFALLAEAPGPSTGAHRLLGYALGTRLVLMLDGKVMLDTVDTSGVTPAGGYPGISPHQNSVSGTTYIDNFVADAYDISALPTIPSPDYTTDFTGTDGASWPSGWSNVGALGSGTTTIQGNKGQQAVSGGSGTAYRADGHTWAPDDYEFTADVDVTTGQTMLLRVLARLSSSFNRQTYLEMGIDTNQVLIGTTVDAGTTPVTVASQAFTFATGTYHIRLRVFENTIIAKIWSGSSEPVNWLIQGATLDRTATDDLFVLFSARLSGSASMATNWDNVVLRDQTLTPLTGGGGPVALAGQSDGVSTATGTLATPHVPGPVALAGRSDGVSTAIGTLGTPGSAVFFEPFTYANGALPTVSAGRWTGFGGAGGSADAQVVSGHIQTLNNTAFHDNYLSHGLNVSGDWQLDFDCDAPLNIGAGGADVYLVDVATSKGYSVFIGNAVHVQVQAGSGPNNITNVGRTGQGSGGHLANHVTCTHKANGDFAVYLDRVLWASVNDTSQASGPHLVVEPQSSNSPTFETTIDNLRLQNYIDLTHVDLDGSSVGVSTATGTMAVARGLAGQSDGVATVTGALVHAGGPVALDARADGVATATGTLAVARSLGAQADGVSTVTPSLLAVARDLRAGSVGTGGTTALLGSALALVGRSDGVGGAQTPVLAVQRPLSGQSDGSGGVQANGFPVARALGARSDGVGGGLGDMGQGGRLLSGQSDGVSTVTGTLAVARGIAGRTDGVATVVGDVGRAVPLAGRTDGGSTVTGAFITATALAGRSDGISGAGGGSLARAVGLRGSSAGVGTAQGSTLSIITFAGGVFVYRTGGWSPQVHGSPPIEVWNGTRWETDAKIWDGNRWQPLNP